MADYDLWYIFPDGRKVFVGPVVQGVIEDGEIGTVKHYTTLAEREGGRAAHKLNSPYLPLRETKEEAGNDLHLYIINRWDSNYNTKVRVYINGFVVGWNDYIDITTGRKDPPQSSDTKERGCTMAQEQTTVKRCETCGRIGACTKLRRDMITDMRGMKMEDTPGYCDYWVDGKKFLFEIPGCVYQAERGTALNIYEKNQVTGEWKISDGAAPSAACGQHRPEGERSEPVVLERSENTEHRPSETQVGAKAQEGGTETLPATPTRVPIDFKALDKVIDIGKSRDLAKIEARIEIAKQQTMGALLEIGRCLNEAKDRNLVPHGQWEQWAADQTGLAERTRQRIMQAAREIPAGSAMERLDFTKAVTLLALPEGDREAAAEKAEEEKTPLRKLQLEVGQLTKKLNQAETSAKWEKENAQRRLDEKDKKIGDLTGKALDLETAKLELHKAQRQLDAQTQATKQALDRVQELEKASEEGGQPEHGISKDAQLMLDKHAELIAKLRQDKADAEKYAEEQAQLRQEAQQEMLRLKSQAAHGQPAGEDGLTGESLAEAVRVFLGSAGVLPHMGKMLCQLPAAEREKFQRNIAMMAGWVEGARRALDMVVGEMAVSDAQEV